MGSSSAERASTQRAWVERLALRAVAVAARVVDGPLGAAAIAALEVPAEGGRTTDLDRVQHAALRRRERQRPSHGVAVVADDPGERRRVVVPFSCRRASGPRRRAHRRRSVRDCGEAVER